MENDREESREKSCGVEPLTSNSDAVSRVRVSVVLFFLLGGYFFAPSCSSGL